MKNYECEHCHDTGWYGDNGPGIRGNNEYMACDMCWRGKVHLNPARICNTCDHCSDRYHELDPLGEWKWCELHQKDVHEDDETCENWEEQVIIK
jgi:hypothetical protein